MKKFLATLLALVLMFSLVACGSSAEEPANTPANTDEPAQTDAPVEEEKKLSLCFICEALGDNSFNDASDIS